MAEKNKLSIYLIKDEYSDSDQQILKSPDGLCIDVKNVGKAYIIPSRFNVPSWVSTFFCNELGDVPLFTANSRAVLISRVVITDGITKTFAVTLGYGKNMLADSVYEEDFGLRVVMNTIEPTSLRRINRVNVGGNQKTSNEQLPLKSDIDGFGFDIDRDLIGTITGYSDDQEFVKGILTGSDMFSLTTEVDINNLVDFLKSLYSRYISNAYKENFGWVDHIRKVKNRSLISALDTEMLIQIINKSPSVWMAVPDVINWEDIQGFRYCGKELHDDINLDIVLEGFKTGLTHIDQLKSKRIYAIRADNGAEYSSWSAYKCIYGEIEHNGSTYCINNGRWFCVDKDFVDSVNAEYDRLPVSEFPFLSHQPGFKRESEYTDAFVNSDPNHLLCMDMKLIAHGSGHSRIELCDVLTTDDTYIHIKPYSGSSTLSHLFNQAVVSAESVMSDSEFRSKANERIKRESDNSNFLISANVHPTVILAIISKSNEERPPIPFFSKIALRYASRRLRAYGCKISIKNIHRD